MKTRILSALIMLPLLIFVVIGGYVLYAGCVVLSIMAVNEFYKGFKELSIKPSMPIAVGATIVLYGIGLAYILCMSSKSEPLFNLFGNIEMWYMLWLFAVVLAGMLYLFKINDRKLEDAMATIVGIVYIPFFFYHLAIIQFNTDPNAIWLVFITAFGTDIMAYFSGYAFGKHKLCPNISPKKTIEGSVGGTLSSIILCGVFGYLFMPYAIVHCMIIGLLGGIVSQLGDLSASIFKRKMGIKDYGNLIPGHGGVLDRFDSILFTAPLVYYYMMIVLG